MPAARESYLANAAGNWQSFFLARVQNLTGGVSQTFTIQANGATGDSNLRDQRIMAFRTDAFESFESSVDLAETTTNQTTPQVKTILNTSAAASRKDHIVIQSLVLRGESASRSRNAGFEADDVAQTSYAHVIASAYTTSFGLFDARTTASAIKYENTCSSSNASFNIHSKESVIHVLRLPTCTPTANYRSIGTNTGILYNTGTASVDAGALNPTTVTFGGVCRRTSDGETSSSSIPPALRRLFKAADKGAIAAFSPSGLSLHRPAMRFQTLLLEELSNGTHARLGDAVLAAQESYTATGAFPELLAIYHLFGDPALALK